MQMQQAGLPIVNNCRILVIGAGATGNEVLKNIALIGAGRIAICDMDWISTSNLSRTVLFSKADVGKYKAKVAAERVKEMSVCPDIHVDFYIGDIVHGLGAGIFRQFDVVISCLDNLEARLSATKRCNLLGIPYIDTGINELAVSVQIFHYPNSSCFACGVSSAEIAREYGIRPFCQDFQICSVSGQEMRRQENLFQNTLGQIILKCHLEKCRG